MSIDMSTHAGALSMRSMQIAAAVQAVVLMLSASCSKLAAGTLTAADSKVTYLEHLLLNAGAIQA